MGKFPSYEMFYLSILFCAIFTPFVQPFKVHDYMSENEVQDIFQTTHDNVPEYDVVQVNHILHKRSDNEMTFQTTINGMDRKLYLKPVKGFFAGRKTKVLMAKRNPENRNKVDYQLNEKAMEKVAFFYQDVKTFSAISHMLDDEGNSEFDGVIYSDYVLRPLPRRLRRRRDLSRQNFSSSETDENGFTKIHHIVYKRSPNPHFGSNMLESNSIYSSENDAQEKSKLGMPAIVYPEIMVVLDEILFARFEYNVAKAVHYILSFWNGVDLRFRAFDRPRVLLNIAGIIISQESLPFTDATVRREASKSMADSHPLLIAFGRFLYNEDKLKLKKDYDLAMFMTGIDLYGQSQNVAGYAFVGGACSENHYGNLSYAVGVFEDNTGYSGILSAAHELGHSLGASHDSETDGGPKTGKCSWNDGYIMSYKRINKNRILFSPCSQKSMASFFKLQKSECLRNDPSTNREDKPMPRMLPGKYISLDEQCQKMGFLKAFNNDSSVCLELNCYETLSAVMWSTKTYGEPAAEGSSCGVNMYCLGGECVKETTGIVPDETPQQSLQMPSSILPGRNRSQSRPNDQTETTPTLPGRSPPQSRPNSQPATTPILPGRNRPQSWPNSQLATTPILPGRNRPQSRLNGQTETTPILPGRNRPQSRPNGQTETTPTLPGRSPPQSRPNSQLATTPILPGRNRPQSRLNGQTETTPILPGRNKSPDQECRSLGAIGVAESQLSERVCSLVCKFRLQNTRRTVNRMKLAEDGYNCAYGFHCLSGECVPETVTQLLGMQELDSSFPSILYGERMSLDQQCQYKGASRALPASLGSCQTICLYKLNGTVNKEVITPVMDGYPCSNGDGHCINAVCVSKNELSAPKREIIPDLSLPGKVLSSDLQCKRAEAFGASVREAKQFCNIMCKYIKENTLKFREIPAEDGFPCAKGKYCIFGNCLDERIKFLYHQYSTSFSQNAQVPQRNTHRYSPKIYYYTQKI